MEPLREFVSHAGLIGKRQWTESAIAKFIGAPHRTAPNPHRKNGPAMKLYAIKIIEEVESSAGFVAWRDSSRSRKQGAHAAVETKKRNLLAHIESVKIAVPILDSAELLARALRNYNAHNSWKAERFDDWTPATAESIARDQAFRERITVNYLRHCLTSYEQRLEQMYGKTGVGEGKRLLGAKIYRAIGLAYPDLDQECIRQRQDREEHLLVAPVIAVPA